jgi:hypothetical protein
MKISLSPESFSLGMLADFLGFVIFPPDIRANRTSEKL